MFNHPSAILSFALLLIAWLGCSQPDSELRTDQKSVLLQQRPNTCGPASLAMILAAHGVSVTEKELERRMGPGWKGVSLALIVATADSFGVHMEAWRFRREAPEELRTPAIVWIDGDHFAVLDSVNASVVFLRDPARGRLDVSRSTFQARWNGAAAVVTRTP